MNLYLLLKLPDAVLLMIFTMGIIGLILMGLGVFQKISDIGGMGAALPLSGFAPGIAGIIIGLRADGVPSAKAVKIGLSVPAKVFGCGSALALVLALIFKVVVA